MEDKKIIEYTSPEQQISLLKSKGLAFSSEEYAIQALNEHGYYNIINSYKSPYIEIAQGAKRYFPGTTFEQIYSLFLLDYNLRNSIMAAMLDIEEHLRAAAADVLAKSFGTNQNDYLKWENFRDRRVSRHRFSLSGILETLKKNLCSEKDPIKYYRENYGVIPPWILFKGTYFSTLINFIRLFKGGQKRAVIQKLYPIAQQEIDSPYVKKLFSDTLSMCLEYRNLAAHGGRVYNYNPNSRIQVSEELFQIMPSAKGQYDGSDISQGFTQLLFALSFFSYDNPHTEISKTFNEEINRHCNAFPKDADFLQRITGIKITKKHVVYISDGTQRYHLNPHCSGIKNAYYIPYEEALRKGYVPCKRCAKGITI